MFIYERIEILKRERERGEREGEREGERGREKGREREGEREREKERGERERGERERDERERERERMCVHYDLHHVMTGIFRTLLLWPDVWYGVVSQLGSCLTPRPSDLSARLLLSETPTAWLPCYYIIFRTTTHFSFQFPVHMIHFNCPLFTQV